MSVADDEPPAQVHIAPWWRRDIPFEHYGRFYPPLLLASVGVSIVGALIYPPLIFGGMVVLAGGFVALWGPSGLTRSTRDPRVARRNAVITGAVIAVVVGFMLVSVGR